MTFPCPTSNNQGQHKFGAIKFLTNDRLHFVQACRYCKGMRTGKFILSNSGAAQVVYNSSGLEKSNEKSDVPNVPCGTIDPETGEIGPNSTK